MTRHHEILGGQLDIMDFADLLASEESPFDTADDFVIHAALTLGDGDRLMAPMTPPVTGRA